VGASVEDAASGLLSARFGTFWPKRDAVKGEVLQKGQVKMKTTTTIPASVSPSPGITAPLLVVVIPLLRLPKDFTSPSRASSAFIVTSSDVHSSSSRRQLTGAGRRRRPVLLLFESYGTIFPTTLLSSCPVKDQQPESFLVVVVCYCSSSSAVAVRHRQSVQ